MKILVIAGPNGAGKATFARDSLELYRKAVDDWRVYDNSGEIPVLLAEFKESNAVQEPGTEWRPSRPRQQSTFSRRLQMTQQPGRFPGGEPSAKSIMAALVRARKTAMRSGAEYEAKAAAEAGDGDGETQLAQPVAEGAPVGG